MSFNFESTLETPITIDGVEFKNRLLNASGCVCTSGEDLNMLNLSSSAGIVTKSCTLKYREGNNMPRYYDTDALSINSTGLANMGYEFYRDWSVNKKKPYILSVAGVENGENLEILRNLQNSTTVDLIELNLSCPNIIGKPQIAYDFDATDELLRKVFEFNNLKLGVKLPPYFDTMHFNQMADILNKYKLSFVTSINSLGNGLVYDSFNTVIAPNEGLGGIGGSVIKPFGLSNVYRFSKLLKIPIFGCGGIKNKNDALEYIKAGASMVEIGTQLVKDGTSIFDTIIN